MVVKERPRNVKIRLLGLCAVMVVVILFVLVVFPFTTQKRKHKIVKVFARIMFGCIGAKYEIHGKIDENMQNTMIVANHMSWLDTIVLYRLYYLSFIGKMEMKKWFLLRAVLKSGGTIFIDRKKKRDLLKVNDELVERLKKGDCIGVFPEGTTSNGTHILPFKSSVLDAALRAESKIVPVAICYTTPDNRLAKEATLARTSGGEAVTKTLRLKKLIIKVYILDKVDANSFNERNELADYLYEKINTTYMNNFKEVV